MKCCIHIDIDKMLPKRLSNISWDWSRFCRGSNSEEKKNEIGPISWTFWYILIKLCAHITIDTILTEWFPNLAQEIAKLQLTSVEVVPSSKYWKKVKMAELSEILWWNFSYTLILTIRSTWDCQMSFGNGRSFAEVQLLKNNFQFAPNNHYGFFFLNTLPLTIAIRRDCVLFYKFYAEINNYFFSIKNAVKSTDWFTCLKSWAVRYRL